MKEDKMEYPIITISREFYAGGTTVAKGLSEKLSIPWYEHDVSKLAAQISGYTEEEIQTEGEEISKLNIILDNMLNGLVSYKSSYDEIYNAQKEAILELANKSSCIIVGRCAGPMLRAAGFKTFDIFLYADEAVRIERCVKSKGYSEAEAKKQIEKRDNLRRIYYKKYTGKEYDDFHNYNLCIDTGIVEYDRSIDMIANILK